MARVHSWLYRQWQERRHQRALIVIVLCISLAVLAGIGAVRTWLAVDPYASSYDRVQSLDELLLVHAEGQGLELALVQAVVLVESGGRVGARSHKDARGLMQVRTIAEKEVHRVNDLPSGDLYDSDYNLLIGTTYLQMMFKRFKGDEVLALAAYNCGPTRVAKHKRQDPKADSWALVDKYLPKETRAYCRKVLKARERFRRLAKEAAAQAAQHADS